MNTPHVSVVIPVYNQGRFLAAAIESVLSQDCDAELIVVDDGSTDETPEVIGRYGDRVVGIRQKNRGAAAALNRGVQASSSPLVCWLSADDRFLPGKLRAQTDLFVARSDAGFCCTWTSLVDAQGDPYKPFRPPKWRHPDPFVAIFWRNPVNGSSVMMRRELFEEVGYFDESLTADVDADMWLRLAQVTHLVEIPEVLTQYRVHAGSISADRHRMAAAREKVRERYVMDGTLEARLGSDAPTVLPQMAVDFALSGMPELATMVQRAALFREVGVRRRMYVKAITGMSAAPGMTGVRRIAGAARRLVWRAMAARANQ